MSSPPGSLNAGMEALQQGRYQDAIAILTNFCQTCALDSKEQLQAQMYLVKAYQRNGQIEEAIALCQRLAQSGNFQVQTWAEQALPGLLAQAPDHAPTFIPETSPPSPPSPSSSPPPSSPPPAVHKAGRASLAGVKLAMSGIGGNLAIASGVTLSLLVGMVLVLCLGLVLITDSSNPGLGLAIAIILTLAFNAAMFFLAPWIMDLTQRWLYGTQWITMADLEQRSPESARLIQRICAERKLKQPRLGLINDQNPTAFTYGSLPDSARLVVSQGLFTYLDDDEIATVYAHELGHIVHWDFAVMTLASTLVQITYLIYVTARTIGRTGGSKARDAAQSAAIVAYIFYLVGTYLLLYLSRTREYFADHFAAESTGNPNALSRALVKIAYGIVEEGKRSPEPSRVMEGTRALGIYDAKAATSTGTAYRIASSPEKIGRVFLWDLFNPWGWWMELNSTHPLTGKRVRALSTYAEQLGLDTEFDMARVVAESRNLDKGRLYGSFFLDLLLYAGEAIGLVVGIAIGALLVAATGSGATILTGALAGLGVGIIVKALVMYPNFSRVADTDILTLMSNPYASPLRGQPVRLNGELIGRGDAGYKFGSDLKLQDKTGMIFLRYASRFGPLGNFLFGMKRVQALVGMNVDTTGWFRRGIMPWMDLFQFTSSSGTVVKSYHRFWSFLLGGGAIAVGVILPLFM